MSLQRLSESYLATGAQESSQSKPDYFENTVGESDDSYDMWGAGFLRRLPQIHSGEAECMEICRKSIGKEALPTFSGTYRRSTLERRNVWKYIGNPYEMIPARGPQTEFYWDHWWGSMTGNPRDQGLGT